MNAFTLLTIGFAPGAFWLWIIYQRDRYLPAPPSLVARTFLWGVAIALPASIVEAALTGFNTDAFREPTTRLSAAYAALTARAFGLNAGIVTAAAPSVPQVLLNQLGIGGRLVIPVGSRWEQHLLRVVKGRDRNETQNLGGCRFVPLIGRNAFKE